MTRYAAITGVGSFLPPRRVPNTWFESFVETNDEWIRDRTGIQARHFAEDDVMTSDLAVRRRTALDAAAVPPAQFDMIVCATITGDTVFPADRGLDAAEDGPLLPGLRRQRGVRGFSYGLSTASGFVASGMADTVLLIGAEIFSRIFDFTDRARACFSATAPGPRSCKRPRFRASRARCWAPTEPRPRSCGCRPAARAARHARDRGRR